MKFFGSSSSAKRPPSGIDWKCRREIDSPVLPSSGELFEVVGSVLARQLAADADFQPPIQLAVVPAQAAEHHLIAEALRVVRALHLKGTDFQRIRLAGRRDDPL